MFEVMCFRPQLTLCRRLHAERLVGQAATHHCDGRMKRAPRLLYITINSPRCQWLLLNVMNAWSFDSLCSLPSSELDAMQ